MPWGCGAQALQEQLRLLEYTAHLDLELDQALKHAAAESQVSVAEGGPLALGLCGVWRARDTALSCLVAVPRQWRRKIRAPRHRTGTGIFSRQQRTGGVPLTHTKAVEQW
jgi:hypothetical protein